MSSIIQYGEFYEIADTKDIVYIGKDLPDEYTGSKYTYSLKGANAKAKANASQGIPETLEIAVGKHMMFWTQKRNEQPFQILSFYLADRSDNINKIVEQGRRM